MSAPIIRVCVVHREADFVAECEIHDNGPFAAPELYGLRMRIDAPDSVWESYDETCRLSERATEIHEDILGLVNETVDWRDAFAAYAASHGGEP